MTPDPTNELKRLRGIAEAATPGPWASCPEYEFIFADGDMVAEVRGIGAMLDTTRNAAHITAFNPQTALALIECAEALIWIEKETHPEDGLSFERLNSKAQAALSRLAALGKGGAS